MPLSLYDYDFACEEEIILLLEEESEAHKD